VKKEEALFQALFCLIDHRRTELFCVTKSNAEQEAAEDQQTVKEWIQSLTSDQRTLLRAAFGGAKKLKEIAKQKGVSEEAVSKQTARIAEAVKKAGISCPDLMGALRDLYEADGQFIASEELRGELASINTWLDNQKYEAAVGTPEYRREREEKFARAFEYDVMNGKAPRYTRLTGFFGGAGSLIEIAGFEVVTVSDVHDTACFFKFFLQSFDGNVSGVDPLFRSH
jgi:hypothetical protein